MGHCRGGAVATAPDVYHFTERFGLLALDSPV